MLSTAEATKEAEHRIASIIDSHSEWFCVQETGSPATALETHQIDLRVSQGRLMLSCWTDKGVRTWRLTAWEWSGEKLNMLASRRAGSERGTLCMIPRASASAIAATVSEARRARCALIGSLACRIAAGAKIERMALSVGVRKGEPGRYARVLLRLPHERIAVTGPAAAIEPHHLDAFLSTALIWFNRRTQIVRSPFINKLWLIVPDGFVEMLGLRLALLRANLQQIIRLYQIDDELQELKMVQWPSVSQLWHARPRRILRHRESRPTKFGLEILSLAPDAIDIVKARHGETLRYHGLPFARVRRVMERERIWFGIEQPRRLLDRRTMDEWEALLEELRKHRSPRAEDKRNAFYRSASEAWLESLLRRDITQLDPGMIVAPIHAQFRASNSQSAGQRPIDLLALRRDGRLVVIELKVTEDREHVLQGANYWRQVEAHRRAGNIAAAHLFGDAVVEDEPPLVYLAAPTLSFHRAFRILAHAISPEIQMYRFDINEDWRMGVRVARRCELSAISVSHG